MLSSTTEYLEALRRGDFLRAVEWVEFVRQRYPGIEHNSDALLALCTYELLNGGYTPDDMVHFEGLCALLFEEEGVFQRLDYAATTLFNAGLQVWVWINAHAASGFYQGSDAMPDANAVLTLMQQTPPGWSDAQNNQAIEQVMVIAKARSTGKGQALAEDIRRVLAVRETLNAYEQALDDHLAQTPDFAADSRLSELRRAYALIREETRREVVDEEAHTLATRLRRLNPLESERAFLNALSPLPEINVEASLHRAGTQLYGFFTSLPDLITTRVTASLSGIAAPSGSS